MTQRASLAPAEVRSHSETLQRALAVLPLAMTRAARGSRFWADRFAAMGLDPALGLNGAAALQNIHLLDKPDLIADQQAHGPYGRLLGTDPGRLARIHRTSGTTSEPLLVLLTRRDVANVARIGGRAFRSAGAGPGDVVVHCLNYCMWSGGVSDHQAIEASGAAVVPFGVGNSDFLVRTILRLRPTALSCTPSYLSRLRQLLEAEFKLTPRDLGLKMVLCGGEGGLQDPAVRDPLEAEWGARMVDANYGLSEVLSIVGAECEARDGLHYHAQDVLLPELIDESGRTLEIVKRARGELVLSTLQRQAQPLFRYRTHDVIDVISTDRCSCGRSGFRFRIAGRSDDMVVVRGVNFFPSVLQGLLRRFGELSGEFLVYAPPPPVDALRLEAELARDAGGVDRTGLAAAIQKRISIEHSVPTHVELVDYGVLPRTDGKTRRLVRTGDRR